MESIDLELGDLFDRDAVAEEGEDVGAQTSGYGDDEVPADGEGWQFQYSAEYASMLL